MISNPRIAIIGAGCSGLASIKNLLQAGLNNIVCYEKNDQIGGNWIYTAKDSSVCETTHIISSKNLSEFLDFPMPAHYPDYPSHRQVLAYFQAYTQHFGLEQYIRFNTAVRKVAKTNKGQWQLTLANGRDELFDALLVANGHHAIPRHPKLPGSFTGTYLHAHDYKTNQDFRDKKVLVIGAGNSGCDCAVEISRVAEKVSISMRRPYYIIPKFMMGRPVDSFNEMALLIPAKIRNVLLKMSLHMQIGPYKSYGLTPPDYPITQCHPVVNSELLYKIRHGKIFPQKGIQNINGDKVRFDDGQEETFDVILAATGYKIAFPFFDPDFIDYSESNRIALYLRMIHPDHQNLFFIGLVQPQGCVWPISDHQAKLVANLLAGRTQLPNNLHQLAQQEADQIAREFINSKRHSLEVHYHPFIKKLRQLIPTSAPEWAMPIG
ncbi:MAG: NAD(P)-binding domain-containing protein [Bacteroidota bacterium]